MKIDAIGVTSGDFAATVRFYGLLGFNFPSFAKDAKHLEATTPPGEVRLMIDDVELMKSIMGRDPRPPTHSSFAILSDSPASVDAACERVRAAGFAVVKQPWDAFWGQRYAVVADPDGYMGDLFAPL
jgi:catechol 2,3-dioxygenase-like lactoylglutathione lyase family enzyme